MNHNQPTKRISSSTSLLSLFTLAMTLLTAVNINAATTTVSSVTALQTAINNANAGDILILANGTYLNNTLSISKSNITVKAATSGGVYLNGSNAITISGDNVTFSGFQFTSGFPFGSLNKVAIIVTGDNVLVTRLNFSGYNASKYISLQGQYDEISYCNFENKPEPQLTPVRKVI
jgi:poly(beta-D-mannuronate) lyase